MTTDNTVFVKRQSELNVYEELNMDIHSPSVRNNSNNMTTKNICSRYPCLDRENILEKSPPYAKIKMVPPPPAVDDSSSNVVTMNRS